MQRAFDWPEKLAAYLTESAKLPFRWGQHDCALHVCNAIQAMTGVDLAAAFRGTYGNVGGAAREMRQFAGGGFEVLIDKIADQHGLAEISPAVAQRGDVAMFDTELGATLGIVSLNGHQVSSVAPSGAIEVPIALCRRAWRIP